MQKRQFGFSLASDHQTQELHSWQDPKTGLEWQCESPGEMGWHQALEYAKSLSLDGKSNWRLPTLAELESLLDRNRVRADGRPFIRDDVPFRDGSSYWSCTTFADDTESAWIVMFDGAYLLSYPKNNYYAVRCVRDGSIRLDAHSGRSR